MKTPARITIVMPMRNELEYIEVIDEILRFSNEIVHEIIVMDDQSDDGTLQALEKKASIFPALQLHRNQKNLHLNEMISFLLTMVTTELVHVRSPHDFYSKLFYEHHFQSFAAFPSCEASFNKVGLISKINPNNLPLMQDFRFSRGKLIKALDKNMSSCGFVCKTKLLRELWKKYESFDSYTDWLVKKELVHFSGHVYSTNTLSLYNDTLAQKQKLQNENSATHEIEEKVFDAVYLNFWVKRGSDRYFCLPRELISTSRAIEFFKKRPFDIWLVLHLCRWILLKDLKEAYSRMLK